MFGGLSLPHVLIVALVVLVLFGKGRISEMMGDFGKGIKSFKDGMGDDAASRAAAADAAFRGSADAYRAPPPAQIAPAPSPQPGVVPPVTPQSESLNVGGQGQA